MENLFKPVGHPYYIFAPDYRENSVGIMALHYLCHALNLRGCDAYIAPVEKFNPDLKTPALTQEIITHHMLTGKVPIAVYPETASGNPLRALVCVRYMLNREGLINGRSMNAGKDDLFFWYSKAFVDKENENVHYLTTPYLNFQLFQPDPKRERSRVLLYINRVPEAEIDFSRLPKNVEVLSNKRPVPLKELAKILQGAKIFYSFEFSGTCTLAILCGCPVVYLTQPGHEKLSIPATTIAAYGTFGYALSDTPEAIEAARQTLPHARISMIRAQSEFWSQLDDFIRITQERACLVASSKNEFSVNLCMQRGMAAFQAEDFATAIASFSELLDKAPENPLPPAYLAFIAARQGEAQAAADFIAEAARIAPARVDLKAALGESFLKAGRPDLAAGYLEEAISAQPDLWSAYPTYAQSLHLVGQDEAAIALLQPAAGIFSPAQAGIQNTLLEILAQRGDLGEFTRMSLRFSRALVDNLLAVRALAHFEREGERLLETLGRVQQQLADACANKEKPAVKPVDENPVPGSPKTRPLKIAFLVGDFQREERLQRLPALLRHLPPEDFMTSLLLQDARCEHNDCANLCSLLADQIFLLFEKNDAEALNTIQEIAPDILIDLEAYGPMERLTVFLKAAVPQKLLWGEAPMPSLSPECQVLTGARLAESSVLPCVTLPEMGEYCDLPEYPIIAPTVSANRKDTVLGVLTPAMRIDREGWRLFAKVLKARPDSQLWINLADMGKPVQAFISSIFKGAGLAVERLRFLHAHTAEDLCRIWQETDLGLAPPTDAGDMALPAGLWMGRPYLALASPLPWSRRPLALLELAGAEAWICQTAEDYIDRACSVLPAPNPQFRARMKAANFTDPLAFAQGFATSMNALFKS
jgi:predicted O-linked N-acetylglucosamine transferase (SPINDLY family)